MGGLRRSVRQTTKPDRLGKWLEQTVKQTPEETVTKGKSFDTLDDAEVLTLPPSPPLLRNESWLEISTTSAMLTPHLNNDFHLLLRSRANLQPEKSISQV